MNMKGKLVLITIIILIIYYYIIPKLNFDTIYGLGLGILLTLFIEIIIGGVYLLKSVNKGRENKNIILKEGGISEEERKILEGGQSVEKGVKKKEKFFVNSYSNEGYLEDDEVVEKKLQVQQDQQEGLKEQDLKRLDLIQEVQNVLQDEKLKLKRKKYLEQIQFLEKFLECLIFIEKQSGEGLLKVGLDKLFIRKIENKLLVEMDKGKFRQEIKSDEKEENDLWILFENSKLIIEKNIYKQYLKQFDYAQEVKLRRQSTLNQEMIQQKKISGVWVVELPWWETIKKSLQYQGKKQQECGIYLQNAVKEYLDIMKKDYSLNHAECKKNLKQYKQDNKQNEEELKGLLKLKDKQDSIHKDKLSLYQNSGQSAEMMVKLQNDLNTLKYEKQNVKIKIQACRQKQKELSRVKISMIKLANDFKLKNNFLKQKMFQYFLKEISQAYLELCQDLFRIGTDLLNWNFENSLKENFNLARQEESFFEYEEINFDFQIDEQIIKQKQLFRSQNQSEITDNFRPNQLYQTQMNFMNNQSQNTEMIFLFEKKLNINGEMVQSIIQKVYRELEQIQKIEDYFLNIYYILNDYEQEIKLRDSEFQKLKKFIENFKSSSDEKNEQIEEIKQIVSEPTKYTLNDENFQLIKKICNEIAEKLNEVNSEINKNLNNLFQDFQIFYQEFKKQIRITQNNLKNSITIINEIFGTVNLQLKQIKQQFLDENQLNRQIHKWIKMLENCQNEWQNIQSNIEEKDSKVEIYFQEVKKFKFHFLISQLQQGYIWVKNSSQIQNIVDNYIQSNPLNEINNIENPLENLLKKQQTIKYDESDQILFAQNEEELFEDFEEENTDNALNSVDLKQAFDDDDEENEDQDLFEDFIDQNQQVQERKIKRKINKEKISRLQVLWLQKLLSVFYNEWKQNDKYTDFVKEELWIILNSDYEPILDEIKIINFKMSGPHPQIHKIKQLQSEPFEFLADFEISYPGKILLEIETTLFFSLIGSNNMKVPVRVIVILNQISANLRICYVESENGWSWFSFVGNPSFELKVEPILRNYNLSKIPKMADLIKTALDNKIKLLCYPNKKRIEIPLTSESQTRIKIEQRNKEIRQNQLHRRKSKEM